MNFRIIHPQFSCQGLRASFFDNLTVVGMNKDGQGPLWSVTSGFFTRVSLRLALLFSQPVSIFFLSEMNNHPPCIKSSVLQKRENRMWLSNFLWSTGFFQDHLMVWPCRDSLPAFPEVPCDGALLVQEGGEKLGRLRHYPASNKQNAFSCEWQNMTHNGPKPNAHFLREQEIWRWMDGLRSVALWPCQWHLLPMQNSEQWV